MPVNITEYFGMPVKTATKWSLLASRLFGKRVTGTDSNTTVIGYKWRGNFYVRDVLTFPIHITPPAAAEGGESDG